MMKKELDERQRQTMDRLGGRCFILMFLLSAASIVVQMVLQNGSLIYTAGETVILLAGGAAYLAGCVKNGIFRKGTGTPDWKANLLYSAVFSCIFSAVFGVVIRGKASPGTPLGKYIGLFFVLIFALGFAVLSVLSAGAKRSLRKSEEKYLE